MSNSNINLQTQSSNALHNAIMEAGSKDRPPMLAPGNYVQWKSRIKRYIDTKPNSELIHYCLQNPPYTYQWAEKTVPVAEGSSETTTERYMENYKNVSQDIRDQLNAEAEAVQIILTGIDNDIYSTVDACPNACEMWKAIERLKQGESINVQDLETNLYWEFGKFTSRDGESLESYYSRFYKMMNELVRNQCHVTNHQVNVQFLLQLQPEWQRFVTLVKQSQELKTVSYHKLYDILKQHQNEVNEIRAERLARTANPLALVAQQQPVYHHQNHPTQNTQYSSTRSQQSTRNRGKAIVTSSAPTYDPEPATVTEDEEMSKEKEIDKLMALISLSFKKIYKPTNNNLRTSSNTSRANQDNSPRINRGTGSGIGSTLYVNMAQLQGLTQIKLTFLTIFDDEPMHKDDQDDTDDLDQERDLLASLIQKLKCEIDDSKNRNKFLESSNKALTPPLKKFQAELDKYNDVNYASKVEIDCAKAKGDLMSYKIDFEKSSNAYTRKINDLNQTISDMKKELCAHQETISIMSQAKEAQIKLYKTRKDKELDKVIALENKVKVLNDIVYKTGQSVQTMNMLNRCYNDNLALMLAPDSDEMIRLDKERRSKLSDLIRAFDYDQLNNLYDLFVPQWEKSAEQHYFPKQSKMSHTLQKLKFCKDLFRRTTNFEMVADLRYFNSLEHEVDTLKSQLETQKTQFLNEIDRLSREYYYADHMNAILGVYTDLDEVTNLQCDYLETLKKCEHLEKELSKSRTMSKSFEALQKHAINLELDLQQCKEKIKNDKSFKENQSNVFLKEREQYFEIQDLKAQLQDKGIAISELKKLIEKMKGKSVETKFEKSSVIRQPNAFKSQRQSILGKPAIFLDSLAKKDFSKSKSVTTQNVSHDFSKPVTTQILPQNVLPIFKNTNVIAPGMYKVHTKPNQTRTPRLPQDIRKTNKRVSFSTGVTPTTSVSRPQLKSNQLEDRVMPNNSQGKKQNVEDHRRNFKFSNNKTSVTACNDSLNAKTSNVNFVCVTCGKCVLNDNHDLCVLHYINGVNSRTRQPMAVPISTREPKHNVNQSVATSSKKTVATDSTVKKSRNISRKLYEQLVKIILCIDDSWCSKHMTGNLKLLTNFVENILGTVKFGNDQIVPILGCGDLVQGTITIKRVYYVEGLNHNLFFVGQFCDADLEVAFQKSTCYIWDLKGNDLLTGSRGTDLYSITPQDSTTPNPICLMAKATSSQVWLWHRRLSHLNFNTINLLLKNNIVNGLPKLKFVKDHLCSSCELGKAKRKSFHTKTTPSSKRRLQLLHMDLRGPIRVESINGKKYVLVIVDDYSRYTWTHFLRSKDETPGVLIDFLTLVQRGLHAQVTTVQTDKGTEFLNKTLHAYFAKEGIRHETSTARTMLSTAKVPLFFWAEAIATT
ncbi:retrovirus-related pol polyprotein from transposon TNT 1-94 [Tanacetum coccineum]